MATDMGENPKTTTTTIQVKISDIPSNAFRFNALKNSKSMNQLSNSLFKNLNIDANKFIIICIILVTFIICTILISVIFAISRGGCRLFSKPATTVAKSTHHYNDNPIGYNADLIEKPLSEMTNPLDLNKSINYPFDCEEINSFEHSGTSYLPPFYDQTLSAGTLPYTFPDTGLRYYDQILHGAENSIQLHTSPTALLGNDPSVQVTKNHMNSMNEQTAFANRLFTNYYPTNNSSKCINYAVNGTSLINPNGSSDHINDNNNNNNNISLSNSRYPSASTHLQISFPNNPVISRRDSQISPMTSGYIYRNLEHIT
ncbi:unnamed protein product [Trichobilharzia regenti]|nr:unnamed protein product [Trichobilharzia regenti]